MLEISCEAFVFVTVQDPLEQVIGKFKVDGTLLNATCVMTL